MTTIQIIRRRVTDKKTGKRKRVCDLRLSSKGRTTLITLQGYSRVKDAVNMMLSHVRDFRTNRVRWKGFKASLVLLMASLLPALAVNSPRPSSFNAQGGRLVLVWTNLSEAHPWLLSYRLDMNQPWQWDTTRLHATNRSLSVAVPMTNNQGFMRLWPAAPEQ